MALMPRVVFDAEEYGDYGGYGGKHDEFLNAINEVAMEHNFAIKRVEVEELPRGNER